MGDACTNFVDSPSKEPKCQFIESTDNSLGRASQFSNKSVKVWTKDTITTGMKKQPNIANFDERGNKLQDLKK